MLEYQCEDCMFISVGISRLRLCSSVSEDLCDACVFIRV